MLMAVKLRTRLFLVVAVLLGASIAVSALLSRRATLVEVRSVVRGEGPREDPAPVLERAEQVVRSSPDATLEAALASIEDDTKRRVLVVDTARKVIAASNPELARARVSRLTEDGVLTAEIGDGETRGVIEIRGTPIRRVVGHNGQELIVALLPTPDEDDITP